MDFDTMLINEPLDFGPVETLGFAVLVLYIGIF